MSITLDFGNAGTDVTMIVGSDVRQGKSYTLVETPCNLLNTAEVDKW